MKKLAFFLALFVGLNAGAVARRPEEEENQAIIVNDSPRYSTAALIKLIAGKLKACFYGITREGIIHELKLEIIQELNKYQNVDKQQIKLTTKSAGNQSKVIWIQMSYHFENSNERTEYQLLV